MMRKLPSHLNRYQHEAQASLEQGLIKEIEFSGPTYQILIEDLYTHANCWVFLQLEGKKEIKDAFCSCEASNESEEKPACLHMATAYLGLYGSYSNPLHQRFDASLWNQLCRVYAEQLGDDLQTLKLIRTGHYSYQSTRNKTLFFIDAKTPQAIQTLESLLTRRPRETEETSLKFSNLSAEELILWREGRPSVELRYQLSYWIDLAKWLMRMQEDQIPYHISFKYGEDQVPNWIQIHFNDVELGFYLSHSILAIIIASLITVQSPLTVHYLERQGIAKITYDKKTGHLSIKTKAIKPATQLNNALSVYANQKGIAIGEWIYIPEQGFFTDKSIPLLQTPVLQGEDLSQALTEHGRLIASFLTKESVHLEPVTLSYQLDFDKNWNLHISYYLFEPGDLSKGDSRIIEDWVYLDQRGFYRLEGKRFEEIETVIPLIDVSDFVSQNRAWLSTIEGFQPHVKSLEYQVEYEITSNQRLVFNRWLLQERKGARLQDFGAWFYLEEAGFYPKTSSTFSFLFKPGVSLSSEQIPLFIKMNRDELTLIPQFFSSQNPIAQSGLRVELIDRSYIKVIPVYIPLPEYQERPFLLFDDFVYIEGEGFYELPFEYRLPDKFKHPLELKGKELEQFLRQDLKNIQQWIFFIDPFLIQPQELHLVAHSVLPAEDRGRGWCRFTLSYQTEKGELPIEELWKVIKKNQIFAFSEAGLIDGQNKRYEWIRHLKKDRFDTDAGAILLTTLEFMRLNAFDPITFLSTSADAPAKQEFFDELTQLHTPEEPNIQGLMSHLRPYQEIGVKWLWFLYHQQLSGLLCDDMGLGKTHQAMGLMASIFNLYQTYAEGTKCHFLIVCPTSVIYHWQEKLQQFMPSLRVCTFYGSKRSLEDFDTHYDVLLTSYGILRNERQLLANRRFELAIFDEIQIAKNANSRVYAALTQLKVRMKLGLTGTPIENRLRELKSLFDIILPSYMPNEQEYRDFFIRPIEKEQNWARKEVLNRVIKPFTLRRKKEEVLKDLPEKIEEVAYCDLLPDQHQLYIELLQQRQRHLIEELRDEKHPVPYLHIFAILSSLKQICDHPAAYLKMPHDYKQYQSGKWELFLELLREARNSKQKVVVFSQYLAMLDIIEHYLTEQEIGFASLRGSTQNRKEQLQTFNRDPNCEVFVGSLHAAGLGVDLTAGSVVIHYDRWWNAARENQATDRVHRIGQLRGVQVFKLVTKGTFEEKIDAMIAYKGKLMEDIIGADDQDALKKLSREDLIELLTLVDTEEEHILVPDEE